MDKFYLIIIPYPNQEFGTGTVCAYISESSYLLGCFIAMVAINTELSRDYKNLPCAGSVSSHPPPCHPRLSPVAGNCYFVFHPYIFILKCLVNKFT